MKALLRLAKNARALDANKIFIRVVQDKYVQAFIIDLNRFDQLFKEGKDADDDVIGFYSARTEQLAAGEVFNFSGFSKSKKAGDPIFLLDKGGFYRSFQVRVDKDGFFIEANTIVDDGTDLTKRFGKLILGLTDESKTKFVQWIRPYFIEETRAQLFKNIRR